MKRNKKILGATVSVFAVFIILSSSIVVPTANKEAVDNMLQSDEQIPMSSEEILDYCYEIVNKPIFNIKLQNIKQQIINYIDNNFETDEEKQIVYDFLNIDTAFNLNSIITRLNELDVNNLLESAYNNFDKEETAEDVLNSIFINYDENEFNPMSFDDVKQFWMHPISMLTCNLLGLLSILWLIPLAILLGYNGLYVGGIVSLLLFLPITYPICIYVATGKIQQEDPDKFSELWDIFIEWGLFGLTLFGVPWILDTVYTGTYTNDEGEEVTYYDYGETWVIACLIWMNWFWIFTLEEESYGSFNTSLLEEIEDNFSVMTEEIEENFLISGEVTYE
jgi:hypothetical protein